MPSRTMCFTTVILLGLVWAANGARAQEAQPGDVDSVESKEQDPGGPEGARKKASDVASDLAQRVDETAKRVDEDQRAQELSTGILNPIYQLAEHFSFSSFHWLAFAMMVAGTVSFAGQLVLGKLVMLAKRHFSLIEILSGGLGLLISLIGLVLTTQAATENSQFTSSPFAVLSAAAAGAAVGVVFYLQGQSQELRAARAGKKESRE